MKSFLKYMLLLTFSGYVYVCIELLWRGYSDISMMFCASIGVIPMIVLNNYYSYELDFAVQMGICSLFATGIEWITGLLVNTDYSIWDYRNMPFASPDGMVCVPYMILWGLLAALIIPLMDYIDWKLFGYLPDVPPYYKICGKTVFTFGKKE